ncbi:glycoside hydrolase family 24 protein [Crassisporium funariophilum]|nr:glycoside hydrolase family 24 protein [Crassisporium funariophilum]
MIYFALLLCLATFTARASIISIRGCIAPPVNDASIALIKTFEGFVPTPAPDPIGLPTVGYGHLCKSKGCSEVPYPFPLSQADATNLLHADLASFQMCITLATADPVTLNDNQFGALVSWAFNIGCGNVRSSTLIRRLNAGENPNTVATSELPLWNKAGGKVLPGLVRRRAAEVRLFQTASGIPALPAQC